MTYILTHDDMIWRDKKKRLKKIRCCQDSKKNYYHGYKRLWMIKNELWSGAGGWGNDGRGQVSI